MKAFDWIIIAIILVFGAIPDPLDIFDFGLPIIEGGAAIGYYLWRRK